MNIKVVFTALIAVSSVASFAAPTRQSAGELEVKGSQKGRVAIVNKQSRVPVADLQTAAAIIEKETRCRIEVGPAEGAQVVVEVIDDKDAASLTAYPEDYKAVVNVAKMEQGLKGDAVAKFFVPRCRKEILRAFCYACGAAGTQYPGNILAVSKISDLDMVGEFIPGDTGYACQQRLASLGVTQKVFVSYARAVRDGWAPAPTNDAQKAVWERVKARKEKGPTNPIKINPPTK